MSKRLEKTYDATRFDKAYDLLIIDSKKGELKGLKEMIKKTDCLMKYIKEIDAKTIDAEEDMKKFVSEELKFHGKWNIIITELYTPIPEKGGLLVADAIIPNFDFDEFFPVRLILTCTHGSGGQLRPYLPKYMKWLSWLPGHFCKKNEEEWVYNIAKKIYELNLETYKHFQKMTGYIA